MDVSKLFEEALEKAIRYNFINVLRDQINAEVRVEIKFSENTVEEFAKKLFQSYYGIAFKNSILDNIANILRNFKNSIHLQYAAILKGLEKLLKVGFRIEDGLLIYDDTIYAKKIIDSTNNIYVIPESERKFYVKKIIIDFSENSVVADGWHPHIMDNGKYCLGNYSVSDIPSIFPQIFEIIYIDSLPETVPAREAIELYNELKESQKPVKWVGDWK